MKANDKARAVLRVLEKIGDYDNISASDLKRLLPDRKTGKFVDNFLPHVAVADRVSRVDSLGRNQPNRPVYTCLDIKTHLIQKWPNEDDNPCPPSSTKDNNPCPPSSTKTKGIIIVCLISFLLFGIGVYKETKAGNYESGLKYYLQGNFHDALYEFTNCSTVKCKIMRSKTFFIQGRLEEAWGAISDLDLDSSDPNLQVSLHTLRGDLATRMFKHEIASTEYKWCLNIIENHSVSSVYTDYFYTTYATFLCATNEIDEARAILETYKISNSYNCIKNSNLGYVYLMLGINLRESYIRTQKGKLCNGQVDDYNIAHYSLLNEALIIAYLGDFETAFDILKEIYATSVRKDDKFLYLLANMVNERVIEIQQTWPDGHPDISFR